MFSDRIWPLRPRSRLSRMFLTKFASFWTRCLCFLFSMRSQIACCRSLRVRCRGVCRSHRSCFPSASFLTVGPFSLQILNCTLWTAPACHTAPLEIVRSQVCFIICIYAIYAYIYACDVEGPWTLTSCLSTVPSCRFKLPEAPPGPPVQHVADATGVQSAGVGPQGAAQLTRQLPAAHHFQHDGHEAQHAGVTSKRPHQRHGIAVCLLSWQFSTWFPFSSTTNKCWRLIMWAWTKSRRTPARLWTPWLWHSWTRPVKIKSCVSFFFFFFLFVCF